MDSLYVKFLRKKCFVLMIFVLATILTILYLNDLNSFGRNLSPNEPSATPKLPKYVADMSRLCPDEPPGLVGDIPVNQVDAKWHWKVIEDNYTSMYDIKPGGRWKPNDCEARHRVSIVVPYRDREYQLKVFIRHMHPFLRKHQIDYGIYIVEMPPDMKFNRAMLMNIGFVESLKIHDYQCFMFHDVDLLPENDYNIYSCPQQDSPRHMSAYINSWGYKLRNKRSFGGVSSMTKEQMHKVNGYSNIYFGWGCEDDDMFLRVVGHGMRLKRYPEKVARYKMLKHGIERRNPIRRKLLGRSKERWNDDGLQSNLKYKVISLELRPLYTLIKVDIDEREVTNKYSDFIKRAIKEIADHDLFIKKQKEEAKLKKNINV